METFAGSIKAFAGLVLAVSLCAGCTGIFGVSDDCPSGAVAQQKEGLAAVKAELPPGTGTTKEILNDCQDSAPPSFTVYVTGKSDPIAEILKRDSAWTLVPPEASDPDKRGTMIKRPFKGATLFVGSGPYTDEQQKEQPEPGVYWYLGVDVR